GRVAGRLPAKGAVNAVGIFRLQVRIAFNGMAGIKEIKVQLPQGRRAEPTPVRQAQVHMLVQGKLGVNGWNGRRCVIHRIFAEAYTRTYIHPGYRPDLCGNKPGVIADGWLALNALPAAGVAPQLYA